MKRMNTLLCFVTLACALALCCGGCGGGAGSSFSSKWTIEVSELTGGKKSLHYIDLAVKGDKFFMHRKEPMEMESFGFGEEGVITHECDVAFDGKTLWEFNRKTSYDTKGDDEELDEWNKEQQNTVLKMEPDSTALEIIRFWKVPKGLPTERTAKDKILGRDVEVFTSRQRSSIGADVVLTFWIDPSQKVILKRQDSTGGESEGKGTSEEVFGRKYTCTEFTASPSFPKDRFTFKPGASQKVETLSRYPFSI
ncbi:MAG: hypothetical protein RDV48_31120 [Candidatus Eremiobacteraeota bacterium]|nr:hypothetical protein [Candidatus Eremiobacteraeota bacterium]